MRKMIFVRMKKFSDEAINEVWPEYFSIETLKIESCIRKITYARMKKDTTPEGLNNFKQYSGYVREIDDLFRQTLYKQKAILECEKRIKRKKRKNLAKFILYLTISGFIGFIFGLFHDLINLFLSQ